MPFLPHLSPGRRAKTIAANVLALMKAGFSRREAKEIAYWTAGYQSPPAPAETPTSSSSDSLPPTPPRV